MKVATVLFAALIAAAPTRASAQAANPLAATYQAKLGDIVATTLSEFLKIRADLRDPAIVTYEPETGTIDVEVFASPNYSSKTDQARATLGKFWTFIQGVHVPYVERRFKTKLTTAHYRLIYYDAKAQGAPQIVLQFINGQYLIP